MHTRFSHIASFLFYYRNSIQILLVMGNIKMNFVLEVPVQNHFAVAYHKQKSFKKVANHVINMLK